ncbi:hypothetical protein pah_c016o169 [Parachlamydia acanthamoebae str. Hall's coccus]|nr:hypothetical protein pah_c016o169 [Parachlamydia acanthamoebae str. Hall's coccus]
MLILFYAWCTRTISFNLTMNILLIPNVPPPHTVPPNRKRLFIIEDLLSVSFSFQNKLDGF